MNADKELNQGVAPKRRSNVGIGGDGEGDRDGMGTDEVGMDWDESG